MRGLIMLILVTSCVDKLSLEMTDKQKEYVNKIPKKTNCLKTSDKNLEVNMKECLTELKTMEDLWSKNYK